MFEGWFALLAMLRITGASGGEDPGGLVALVAVAVAVVALTIWSTLRHRTVGHH